MSDQWLWIIVVACGLGTFMWRILGVVFARRIDPTGPLFEWVSCVSYAMVAGLSFRLLILPENDLASVPLGYRVVAIGVAFACYYLFRRVLVAGVLAGSGTMMLMVYWLGI